MYQWSLNVSMHETNVEGLLKCRLLASFPELFIQLGWTGSWKISIYDKFPGDVNTATSGVILSESLLIC